MNCTYHFAEIDAIVQQLWEEGKSHKIWAFHATMGSGKTTLIHALCRFWGVKDAVSSPTYGIINVYASPTNGSIAHMDWYRLKDEEEAIMAGVEDTILSGNRCLIEWPENAQGLLEGIACFHLYIDIVNQEVRKINTKQG